MSNWKLISLTEEIKKDRDRLIQEGVLDFEPDNRFPKLVHPTWYDYFPKEEWGAIKNKIDRNNICPIVKNIFRAFFMDINDVTCIFMGQSPYPTVSKGKVVNANGLAFCVDHDKIPLSLEVIKESLMEYLKDGVFENDLNTLRGNGVVMLNSQLTCEKGKANSHKELWKPFMTKLVTNLNSFPLIWVFIGKDAQEYMSVCKSPYQFKCMHPAAVGYNRDLKFDMPFKDIEEAYKSQYGNKLHWVLPF